MTKTTTVVYRPWRTDDLDFLWDMLYQSIHVRDGRPPPPLSVLDDPSIAHYLNDFGTRVGDDAQLACDEAGVRVGAAFCRLLGPEDPGFGFVDRYIPEVGMAVIAPVRGRGVGRRLLFDLLDRHPTMSLSVDDDNHGARKLYETLGFETVEMRGTSRTMLRRPPSK